MDADSGIPSSIEKAAHDDDDVEMDRDTKDIPAVKKTTRLTDLFDDDDDLDDEEFPSSAPVKHQPSSPPQGVSLPT
jgi:hypothetical protein